MRGSGKGVTKKWRVGEGGNEPEKHGGAEHLGENYLELVWDSVTVVRGLQPSIDMIFEEKTRRRQ